MQSITSETQRRGRTTAVVKIRKEKRKQHLNKKCVATPRMHFAFVDFYLFSLEVGTFIIFIF